MSNLLTQAIESISLAQEEHITEINELTEDYNELVSILERRDNELISLRMELSDLKDQLSNKNRLSSNQHNALTSAVSVKEKDDAKIKLLSSQVKEFQALNPKRLETNNKQLKAKNLELKKTVEDLKAKNKQAVTDVNKLAKAAKTNGSVPFYICPTTGNTLSYLTNIFVGVDNKAGVPDSPVITFFHKDRGITRQGILNREGEMVWASAANTVPTADMITVATNEIKNYCKQRKIKLPKG